MPKGCVMPHKDGHKPIISIVIPTFNQSYMTVKCFQSIRENTPTPYEIVWVDNGSSPDEFSIMKSQAIRPRVHTKLVKFANNTGYVKATNAGIREAEGKYIILLNNDTEVSIRGWEKGLIKPLKDKSNKIGVVGPITQSKISWQESNSLNIRWKLGLPKYHKKNKEYAKNLYDTFGGKYINVGNLPLSFFCAAMRKDVIDEVGLLSEDFGIGLGDDDEYNMRLRYFGYKNTLSLGSFVYHHHRTTFNACQLSVDSIRRRNIPILRKYEKKYKQGKN